MEAVAAAASVAGIHALVGQSIAGIKKLSDFYSDISTASQTAHRLLRDVNALLKVLYGIQNLAERIPNGFDDLQIASLRIQLEDCSKDVKCWIHEVVTTSPASTFGTKRYLRKIKVGIHKKKIEGIRNEIDKNRQALSLSLAVLGRCLDLHLSRQIDRVDGNVDKIGQNISSEYGYQRAMLDRIQDFTQVNLELSAGSISSLQSITSSLSRMESDLASITGYNNSDAATEQSVIRRRRSAPSISSGPIVQRRSRMLRHYSSVEEILRTPSGLGDHIPSTVRYGMISMEKQREVSLEMIGSMIQHGYLTKENLAEFLENPNDDDSLTSNPTQLSLVQMWRLYKGNSTVLPNGQRLQNLAWRILSSKVLRCSTTSESLYHDQQSPMEIAFASIRVDLSSGFSHFETNTGLWDRKRVLTVNIPKESPHTFQNTQHRILQRVPMTLYPPIMLKYFSLIQKLRSAESYCKQYEIMCGHSSRRPIEVDNGEATEAFQAMLKLQADSREDVEGIRKEIHILRKECILAGHSTYEIDAIMTTELSSVNDNGTHFRRPMGHQDHQDIFKIRKHTHNSSLLDGWTDTRDRINR
ncbi:MAG: hypothetical protein Q9223_007192 [Gallowayella weberi]